VQLKGKPAIVNKLINKWGLTLQQHIYSASGVAGFEPGPARYDPGQLLFRCWIPHQCRNTPM
jgi:hypothetical protein